jgi:hypothetical protein
MEQIQMRRGGCAMSATTVNDWKELDSRRNGGIEVSLQWSQSASTVKVVVADARSDETFEIEVAGTDALAAFHHPFALRAALVAAGDAPIESTALHPQDR